MDVRGITNVDYGIIIGYFSLVLIMGYVLARRIKTGDDLFLAGNRLGWAAIGFSLFASNISSASIIGLTGQAYASGISIANYEWMATFILVFIAIWVCPLYLKNRISTVPQYLELRYDGFIRRYYSGLTIFLMMVVDIAASLFAGALVINVFFPEIGIVRACYFIALISGIYTAAGGLAAVVYTDILQSIILILGSSIILYAILGQHHFSWSEAIHSVSPENLSFIRPLNDPELPWLGTLIGVSALGFYYWGTNQYVVQRILGAKNLSHARWGALFGGLLKLSTLFLLVFPGVFALKIFPGLENPDMVFPTMVMHLIPPGVVGLVLAGLIAAIMSSVDSALNASATLIVLDFIRPKNPGLSQRQLALYGRIATIAIMFVAGFWAPAITHFQGIFIYLQLVLTFAVPPVVVIFLLGFFWEKGSPKTARHTLFFGHGLCLLSMILYTQGVFRIHFTILAGLLAILCLIMYVSFEYVFTPSSAPTLSDQAQVTWKTLTLPKVTYKWFENPFFLSFLITALATSIVLIYW